ncbi:MAG: 23S rRNA (adenine(2030)-N(6))-methyltransferase RlmJ, partial [Pseudomonadota bacterium]
IILIDPPFEKKSEADDLIAGLSQALKRFSTGTYLIWYPLKDWKMCTRLRDEVSMLPVPCALDTQLHVTEPEDGTFYGSGMIIINPPYILLNELKTLLPVLTQSLARQPYRGNWATDWLIAPQ